MYCLLEVNIVGLLARAVAWKLLLPALQAYKMRAILFPSRIYFDNFASRIEYVVNDAHCPGVPDMTWKPVGVAVCPQNIQMHGGRVAYP